MVSLKYSPLTVFRTQDWVYVAVRLNADASFCYCKDVSAISIGSCENNSSVNNCCWITTYCNHERSSSDGEQGQAITHFDCDDVAWKTFKDWQFNGTRVRELDQKMITWNMQKALRRKPRFICVDVTWTSQLLVQLQQRCMNLTANQQSVLTWMIIGWKPCHLISAMQ